MSGLREGARVKTQCDGNGVILRESTGAVKNFGYKWLVRLDRGAEELNFPEYQLSPLVVPVEARPGSVGALKGGSR